MYNYIGILRKSSAINKAITLNFLQSSKLNLVLAKENTIEIYNITEDGLESSPYLNVNGKIILLEKIPSYSSDPQSSNINLRNISGSHGDNIFILTEDLDFTTISYNKQENKIINLYTGSVREDIGKRQDKVHAVFENNYEYSIISAYKNLFKIVFLKNRNHKLDYSVRYEYEDLLFLFPIQIQRIQQGSEITNNILRSTNKSNIKGKIEIFNPSNDQINQSSKSQEYVQLFGIIKVSNHYGYQTNNSSDNKTVSLDIFNIETNKQEVNKENFSGPDLTNNPTCSMIIPTKFGGMLIFFSNYVKYYILSKTNQFSSYKEQDIKSYADRKFITYCEIDKFRYLAIDEMGNLFLVAIQQENSNNLNNLTSGDNYSLLFQFLGELNYASTLTYLDNNCVFLGSERANSQLIRITKVPTSNNIRPFIEIIEEYENLAPISDLCIMNNTNDEGNTEILCVSGTERSCSLKTIRKGTSIIKDGEVPFSGVKSIYCILYNDINYDNMIVDYNESNDCQKNILMFINFIDKTKLFQFNYENFSIKNFTSGKFINYLSLLTIHAQNFKYNNFNYVLQITASSIFIYDEILQMLFRIPTIVTPIFTKFKKKNGLLYIYNNNNFLVRYNIFSIVDNKSESNETEISTPPEILSEDLLISSMAVADDFIIYSQWNISKIFIYSLKTKRTEVLCEFEETLFCSGISFLNNEGIKFLIIILSNGKLLYYKLKTSIGKNLQFYTYTSEDFTFKRKYNISNEIFDVKKVKCNGKNCLFLNTDIPGLLSISKESPVISNFNEKDCSYLVDLPLTESYAFISTNSVTIGQLSNSQSQNIITKAFGKQIYNLENVSFTTNSNNLNFIALILEDKFSDNSTQSSFIIMDKHLNEVVRYNLENLNEVCTTFVEINSHNQFYDSNKKLFALGTGIIDDVSIEPETGYIHLLELSENMKLRKVCEIETKGGVYKISGHEGLLFVGICSTLYIYAVNNVNTKSSINHNPSSENSIEYEIKLLRKNSDFTIINDILYHDGYILVSDIYKSITIFRYDIEKDKLIEICRDFSPSWSYSIAAIEKNLYLTTDIDGNIFTLRRELQPRSDEEKYKLERISQFNIGERINKLRNVQKQINYKNWEHIFRTNEIYKNSNNVNLMNNNQNNQIKYVNITYFGTLEGTLGIIASLPKDTFEYLQFLQNEILKIISSTGNFEYEKWRSYKDGFNTSNSKGFVEGLILQEFINFDHHFRLEFMRNIKYPWQRNIDDTINLIESLLKLH